MEAGSAALRVDWPVYPRRAEHITVAEGGNRRWAETASAESSLMTGLTFSAQCDPDHSMHRPIMYNCEVAVGRSTNRAREDYKW